MIPIVLKLEAEVNDAKEVTSVATKVLVPVGNVTFVVPLVVNVKEFAPDVINVDPSTNCRVAEVVGAVIVTLLYVVADMLPLANITPETEELEPVAVNKLPPIPTPPEIVNAPELVEIEAVLCEIFTTLFARLFVNVLEPETEAPVADQ